MCKPRTAYPSDVTDDEWAFLAPYLALVREDAPQRVHSLRAVFNAMRWLVRTGAQWRFMTAANEQEREQVADLCAAAQDATGETIEVAYVDQGDNGEKAEDAAADQGVELRVIKLPYAKKGFVLSPKRWVVERMFAWLGRSRRLARDYERLAEVLAGWHWVAMVALLQKYAPLVTAGSS
ncbi:transposase [Planctomicrobium piriforme]|uniref:Transposase n=1 Tax=Planctomicrobium piriforme TaxID=1576369 RepID=A0A1I3DZ03_9PLAN|nr:transposase [Planctomicrobium piriforme]SFH91873.1 Transposase [Planctomicrobium piriforme]